MDRAGITSRPGRAAVWWFFRKVYGNAPGTNDFKTHRSGRTGKGPCFRIHEAYPGAWKFGSGIPSQSQSPQAALQDQGPDEKNRRRHLLKTRCGKREAGREKLLLPAPCSWRSIYDPYPIEFSPCCRRGNTIKIERNKFRDHLLNWTDFLQPNKAGMKLCVE